MGNHTSSLYRRALRQSARSLGVALGLVFLALGSARAQVHDDTWTGTFNNQWLDVRNWFGENVPNNKATFTNNGAPTAVNIATTTSINVMSFTAAAPAYSFTVASTAAFTIADHIDNSSSFSPAFNVAAGGTLVTGNGHSVEIGSLSGGGTVTIGPTDPTSELVISGNAATSFTGIFSGAGSLTLDNAASLTVAGAGNHGTIGGDLTLCNCSTGGLTIDGGSLAVTGVSTGINVESGTLAVINGGSLQSGIDLGMSGTLIISGPGSTVTVAGITAIGLLAATGTISNGGTLNSQGGAELDGSLGTPVVTVSGAGSSWNVGGVGLAVGGGSTGGPGMLSISGGGAVNVTSGGMVIGDSVDGSTVVRVSGAGSSLSVTGGGSLKIGDVSCGCGLVGTLTIADGATVSAPAGTSIGGAPFPGGPTSTLKLGDGGLAGSIVTPTIANDGAIIANFTDSLTLSATISGAGSLTKAGAGTLTLTGTNSYSGGTSINGGTVAISADANLGAASGVLTMAGGTLQFNAAMSSARTVTLGAGGGTFNTNGNNVTLSGAIGGSGGLTKAGSGILVLGAANSYAGGTTVTGGLINFSAANNFGAGQITLNGGGLQWASGTTADISSQLATLGAGGGTFDTNGNTVTLASAISGTGGLTKQGNGTLILGGANSYSGGTTVSGGVLQGNTTSLQGNILNNASVVFNQTATGTYAGTMSGSGGLTKAGGGTLILGGANSYSGGTTVSGGILQGNSTSLQGNIVNNASVVFNQTATGTYAGAMSGSGGMTVQGGGFLNLTGTSTYSGPTAVNGSTLSVNGSLASTVTLSNGGMLSGNGFVGGVVSNGGTLAPGNSIGTLNVSGNLVQNGGTYQVEANAAGQSDKIVVSGTAAINGGTVQVLAQPGVYAANTTYTILTAGGGVAGAYSSVTSNFAFLTPSLAYTANNVFLTLSLGQNAFSSFGGNTANQRAVGAALDQSFPTSSGDFNTVLNAIAVLSTAQGPAALTAISGQPWADFGTMNVNNAAMFMNALGQQMANARGSSASTGQRQALAQACEVEACDGTGPLSAWASALGGLGSVLGDGNASTLTYNFGGAAAGLDYRFDPRFLVGLGAGYTHGTQWVNSFMGQGWSDSVSVAAYGSFTQSNFYLDALAGYAYYGNQLQRQILIPGLQQRTATGSTGANQFLGQVEGGYKVAVYAPAQASITPFGRFQISSVTQNAFSESGAQSLSLNVAQQTTNSLRTTIGADLASSIGLGNERKLDLAVRLGWQHELADTGRPITAAFAGAPGNSFTVFGATPARDAAVVGFQAITNIAAATQVYLRYDGGVGGGTDNHAINVGLRMSW